MKMIEVEAAVHYTVVPKYLMGDGGSIKTVGV